MVPGTFEAYGSTPIDINSLLDNSVNAGNPGKLEITIVPSVWQPPVVKPVSSRYLTVNIPLDNNNVGLGQVMAANWGWTGDQWVCLYLLWNKESGWRTNATNGRTWGIPQSLPGSKMAASGSDWQTNPATQIDWGLNYIKGSYGNPCSAWQHSQRYNWY